MTNNTIIAVDFDGCLASYEKGQFPAIGYSNKSLINKLIELKNNGHKIILWTCRYGKDLENVIEWSKEYGLYFDTVNENLPGMVEAGKAHGSPKIYANIYIDDKSVRPEEFV